MALLQKLVDLDLASNNLSGPLPKELYRITGLSTLQLEDCAFSGTISTLIGRLVDLRELKIANNNFSGTIPTEISNLRSMEDFAVQGNNLYGSVPDAFCAGLYSLQSIDIIADCTPSEDSGVARMDCSCCTHCCDSETKICLPTTN